MGASIYDDLIKQLDKAPDGGMVGTETPPGVDIRRHQARVSSAVNPRLTKLGKDYRVRVRTTVGGTVALVKVALSPGKVKKPKAPKAPKKVKPRKKSKK